MQHFRKSSLLILGFALLGGGAAGAVAQGLPGGASSLNETHGDWLVACSAAEGVAHCVMSQTQVSGQNGPRVLAIELRPAKTGAQGVIVLPFGLRLAHGVTLAVDENPPLPAMAFSTCLPAGCLVPLNFSGDVVMALRVGTALAVNAAANDTGQEVAFSISLTGFTSALERVAALNGS